jgi:hypothetical protein
MWIEHCYDAILAEGLTFHEAQSPLARVLSRIVLEFGDAFRGSINLADQAARSMI